MKKIVTIIGARPQFIKASAVSRAIAETSGMEEVLVHTGQHFDANMSQVFFEQMGIPEPAYNLDIHGLGHGAMTGRMLEQIEVVLQKERPDWVLVYGDTNSTLAGALAASKMHLKVAHVEAGLRSYNMKMPEEINRILTDRVSNILFCPTEKAMQNLAKEGYQEMDCVLDLCGDVMQDVAVYYANKARKPSFDLPGEFCLSTIHRAENTGDPAKLQAIFSALGQIGEKIPVILPLHPRTAGKIKQMGIEINPHNIKVVEPVGFLEIVFLLKNCRLVLTDSGGMQKEAYFHHKPCLTLRDETEWTELVDHGFNILVGASQDKIVEGFSSILDKPHDFTKSLYGNGNASKRIVELLS